MVDRAFIDLLTLRVLVGKIFIVLIRMKRCPMLEKLFPDIYVKSIYEMPLEYMYKKGIRAIAFDIDNTITPYDVAEPDDKAVEFFKKLNDMGFRTCLLSNNNKERITKYNRRLKAVAIYKAGKPGTKKLLMVLKKLGVKPENAAIVGDQVFTDVLCGNLGGLTSILTAPVCDRDQLITAVKRGMERQVLKIYFKKAGIKDGHC